MNQTPSLALTFRRITENDRAMLESWLEEDHVCEFVDREGNTRSYLDRFLTGKEQPFDHWVACINNTPFCYFLTSFVKSDDYYAQYSSQEGKTISLDVILGNKTYLGKGLAAPTIEAFLKSQFPDVHTVLIDPEVANTRAIHVYEKVGFEKVETFVPEWDAKKRLHLMMRMENVTR